MSVLDSVLSKLARYDEGSLIGSILSFTNVSSSGKDLGQGYVNFFRNNMDQIRGKIGDDLWTLNFFEQWYLQQINMLSSWLSERQDHALHYAQVSSISHIIKVSKWNKRFLNPWRGYTNFFLIPAKVLRKHIYIFWININRGLKIVILDCSFVFSSIQAADLKVNQFNLPIEHIVFQNKYSRRTL